MGLFGPSKKERMQELRCPLLMERGDDYSERWQFDFLEMRAYQRSLLLDTVERVEPQEMHFQLRRLDGPRWETKATADSAEKALERWEKALRNPPVINGKPFPSHTEEEAAQARKEFQELPYVWQPLPEKISPRVETMYQMFLSGYRP